MVESAKHEVLDSLHHDGHIHFSLHLDIEASLAPWAGLLWTVDFFAFKFAYVDVET